MQKHTEKKMFFLRKNPMFFFEIFNKNVFVLFLKFSEKISVKNFCCKLKNRIFLDKKTFFPGMFLHEVSKFSSDKKKLFDFFYF